MLGWLGLCAALACTHAGEVRPRDPRESDWIEQGEPRPDLEAPSSCADPKGNGPAVALRWPVKGKVTSGFGGRGREPHRGIDIAARYGTTVRAAAAGRVVFSARKRGYGRVVILEHAGRISTVYAHNQDNFVLTGSRVEQGQEIAEVGATGNATGPHLHFEVRVANRNMNPLDCLPLRATRQPTRGQR